MNNVSRLVGLFRPDNYNLTLDIDRPNRTFGGVVTITGEMVKPGNKIRLHASGLDISGVVANSKTAEYHLDNNEELVITTSDELDGLVNLKLVFSGTITDTMNGMYPCYYKINGEERELLATQFESHYARRVFPCVDEPEAKATFDVTLITEAGVTALGNMPTKMQATAADKTITTFETTPRMSSYLLAWVVGDLQKVSGKTATGTEVNIWATKAHNREGLEFALEVATKSIDFFNKYFKTPYPLPKSDHVALPDFSSGAMENWGLITYRESALLADTKTSSIEDKRYIATVIAHELSHQWFGNLVTMKWWNDLWLNESFANMMEYFAIDNIYPDWNIWLDYISSGIPSAMQRDALAGVQAVQSDVKHPDEISTLFDPSIVYAKGGRLLRMLMFYIGEAAFRDGLADYFGKYKYSNTSASNLWQCLSEASGKDIGQFMDAWISKPGYPIVHVDGSRLRQSRFFIGEHPSDDSLWPIPIGDLVFDTAEHAEASLVAGETLNHDMIGHFITKYDEASLSSILGHLPDLDVIDRYSLLYEQLLLVRAGETRGASLIDILGYYRNESHYLVWHAVAQVIAELKKFVLDNQAAEKKLRKFVGDLAEKQYDRLGWHKLTDENPDDSILRSLILGLMLYSERDDVIEKSLEIYNDTPLEDIDPDIRADILASAVRNSTRGEVIDNLIFAHDNEHRSDIKLDIVSGLTSTKKLSVIKQLVDMSADTSRVKPQDYSYWLVYLLRNKYGTEYVWQWVRQNWTWVQGTFKNDSNYDAIPRYIASSLYSRQHLTEYSSFFADKKQPALSRNIELGTTELAGRVQLIESESDSVQQKLLNIN